MTRGSCFYFFLFFSYEKIDETAVDITGRFWILGYALALDMTAREIQASAKVKFLSSVYKLIGVGLVSFEIWDHFKE